jgi:hypothetical protein
MRPDRDVTNLAAGRRIDDGQRPAAISDEDSLSCGINANVVGVQAQLNLSRGLVVVPFEQSHRAVVGVGDVQHIGRGLVADALWFLQSWNPVDQFATWEIDNSDGIVAQFGNEQPLSFQIDCHVVDPATDVAERNLAFELERACICRLSKHLACSGSQRHDAGYHRYDRPESMQHVHTNPGG